MSTGSGPSARGAMTDPRPRDPRSRDSRSRGLLYRSNLSDEHLNMSGLDERPNNLDFSDWRPSDVFDQKRIKKENPEKERDKAKEKSLQQDSPPDGARRRHTPSTYPRTRVSAATPAAERRSLERLRQQLQFGDQDEMSQSGSECNNGRGYDRQLNFTDQLPTQVVGETPTRKGGAGGPGASLLRMAQEGRREEQNNARPSGQTTQMPDSNQLVNRLMQVREYIKQAMQMMERLRATPSSDRESAGKMSKLSQVIEQLREQEQNYMDFLMKVLSTEEEALLEEGSGQEDDEACEETTSVDMDAQSEVSEATTEASVAVDRPQIESHLGFYPSLDENRAPSGLSENDYLAIADMVKRRTVIKESNRADEDERDFMESKNRELEQLSEDQQRIHDIIAGQHEAAMAEKKSELDQLRKQRDLLKNMLQQQRQLRDLQGRQVALLQQQRESHRELQEANNEEDNLGATGGTDRGDSQSVDSDTLARQLTDLKSQLDYAKNMYTSQPEKSSESKSQEGELNSEPGSMSSVEQRKNQLLQKLQQLQSEKHKMDDLLNELTAMRDCKFMQLNNELDVDSAPSPVSNSAARQQAQTMLQSADGTIMDANQVLDLLDAQSKVKKLEEVRNRLTQLRDVVQYYESGTRFIHDQDGDEDEGQLPPAMPDLTDLTAMRQDLKEHRDVLNQLKDSGVLEPPQSIVRPRTDKSDDDSSDFNFSLGPFSNDPEILAQVSKLKSAKDRLKRLKDMVEHMPSMEDASAMAAEVDQINASLEGYGGASLGPRDYQTGAPEPVDEDEAGEAEYQEKVEEQKDELRKLMEERKKLMGVQEQLQKLYKTLPSPGLSQTFQDQERGADIGVTSSAPNLTSSGRNKDGRKPSGRDVTFQDPPEVASNEEVYNRMRSQRILREELRSRKRELEAIMRKGDLKKPYSRLNQDNQSDNISYKSDSYGFGNMSADVTTMATWGGSTEQTLEETKNSTHSNSTSTSDNDDDGYPSDGILQVEEEEEAESDANTYTVDDDDDLDDIVAKTNVQPPIVDIKAQQKVSLPDLAKNELRFKPRYDAWASDTYPRVSVQRSKRSRRDQPKQENFRSPEELVLEKDDSQMRSMKKKLELTSQLCQTLMRDQQQLNKMIQEAGIGKGLTASNHQSSALTAPIAPPIAPPTQTDQMAAYTQQLIQQQMQLGLQQCQQLIYQQQMEIRSLNAQFLTLTSHDEVHVHPHYFTQIPSSSPAPLMALGAQWPEEERKEKKKKQEVPKLNLNEMKQKIEGTKTESTVVGRKYPSGDRASAAASLASKITPKRPSPRSAPRPQEAPRPGLSGMISGTSFIDEFSASSQRSSNFDSLNNSPLKTRKNHSESDGTVGLSLFEALRENIYSEVASLISQNETRPHYLIELFRELQLLSSDYLRQRALYALKDLVSATLSQEQEADVESPAPLWMTGKLQTSEQTPSESLLTSDDETSLRKASGHQVTAQVHAAEGDESRYDYVETVENLSSLSTPPSSAGAWDGPFAQDSLGDTVIHLDKAMARMREYERKLTEGLAASNDTSPVFKRAGTQTLDTSESSSSAVDQGNESSESESQPHIDTRQLDAKIKSIMTQVIPILKTHMDDTCSAELLSYMKTVILALAQQRGDNFDHSQFFHKQLSRLIEDTLVKYQGRKMVECVEDLVVDISEILFSELAFYHLMRGLDAPKTSTGRTDRHTSAVNGSDSVQGQFSKSGPGQSSGPDYSGRKGLTEYDSTDEEEDEQMEKDRDDAMAAAMNIESDQGDQSDSNQPVSSIQLAPSETKPYNRIGSDEDDEGSEDDDSVSDKDLFDTAVSRDAEKEADSSKETLLAEDEEQCNEEQREEDKELEGTMEINGVGGVEDFSLSGGGEELTVDDLPVRLDLNQEELLMKQSMDEAQKNTPMNAAVSIHDGTGDAELAGDGGALREPDGHE